MKNKKKIFIVLVLFLSFSLAEDSPLPANNILGTIYFTDGNCYIKNNKTNGYSLVAVTGRSVYEGDIIKVENNGHCSVRFNDDKTHINIESNSTIKINENFFSREINLLKGSMYVKNLYRLGKKTYIFTSNNQIYLNNHRLWVSSDIINGDKIFSLDNEIYVFNNLLHRTVALDKENFFFSKDDISYLNNKEKYIPDYVLSDIGNFDYNIKKIVLKKYDMIPVYGTRNNQVKEIDPFQLKLDIGTYFLSNDTHIKIGFHPEYHYKNLFLYMNIESYVNLGGNNLDVWDDMFDFLEKISINYYHNNKMNDLSVKYGQLNNISFGTGYLVKNLSNSLDYPRKMNAGFMIDYIFDIDFMDLKVFVPNIRDFDNSGGVIGARTSLFISHSVPLTVGIGLVTDLNQFSLISNDLNKSTKKRKVIGAEIDFTYKYLSNLDLDIDFFGEISTLWYPEDTYYVLFDGNDVSNDLRWRKGSWGINAPGISLKFDNRYLFKFSLNFNSPTFIPNYFNSTYLYTRARYYKEQLTIPPLAQKQINFLNQNFLIDCNSPDDDSECEYLIPQDVYPILFLNNGFSEFETYGFTTEFAYNMQKFINVSMMTSVFVENSNKSDLYCSIETSLNITDGYIRNISNMNFYYSNLFFEKISDSYRTTLGFEADIKLPSRLSLIINLGQVYYDSKNNILNDNNIDKMINSNINLKYNF
jgi:hypothetical protein